MSIEKQSWVIVALYFLLGVAYCAWRQKCPQINAVISMKKLACHRGGMFAQSEPFFKFDSIFGSVANSAKIG